MMAEDDLVAAACKFRGRAGNVKGENDPKFAALVQQVTAAMIPPDGLQDFIQNDKQRILN